MPGIRMIAALAALTLQAATAAHAQNPVPAEFFRARPSTSWSDTRPAAAMTFMPALSRNSWDGIFPASRP